ncbi:glycosyltransferase family 4 protein [Shewanella submarina]|uniref:Glycosyltransferase family 4 protein n=1 Tax=Shewanella submarina TaxID=2016376 RepID=A0ABV7GH40_9GAMM|nr:glycosyltransferase family 4 protein [Shewanella submarina]MCL1037493.1 glycosyltransferase family 4 protein [Shewanella submarina]
MNNTYFVHLLDDFSGSPKVLSLVLRNFPCSKVFIGSSSQGFISGTGNVLYEYFYKRGNNKFATLLYYILSQLHLFFIMCQQLKKESDTKNVTVVINTILPFGAAFAAKLYKAKVVYYIHETSIAPKLLKVFLLKIINNLSDKNIYVSQYLLNDLQLRTLHQTVVYNSISKEFECIRLDQSELKRKWESKRVFMACSLKDYKGIPEFLSLAKELKVFNFKLAINDEPHNAESYFSKLRVPKNVSIECRPQNILSEYKESFLVLNLSDQHAWIETFGLTILEAMSAYTPVIGPIVGGPVEVIRNGIDGFNIDSKDVSQIYKIIKEYSMDYSLWCEMAISAKGRSNVFSLSKFDENIVREILGA